MKNENKEHANVDWEKLATQEYEKQIGKTKKSSKVTYFIELD